ncbi:MAG: NAD(+) synthase [Alistipes sp.]|nr:NAD(+) synthase [Alistipes sp.]
MNQYGYVKVAACIPSLNVADCHFNTTRIIENMRKAASQGIRIIAFPELSITSYTCGDLFLQPTLLMQAEASLARIADASEELQIVAIVGLPVMVGNAIYNCAAVVSQGQIVGLVPKCYTPNYSEFAEDRWFASGRDIESEYLDGFANRGTLFGRGQLFELNGTRFGVEICEDVWTPSPPSTQQALSGAKIIFNLSASPEIIGKHDTLRHIVSQHSMRTHTAYVYVSSGFGESSADVVFAGNSFIAENGSILAIGKRFEIGERLIVADVDIEALQNSRIRSNTYVTDYPAPDYVINRIEMELADEIKLDRKIDAMPFVPSNPSERAKRCEEIFSIQTLGLAKRLSHTHCNRAIIGISGGLDSTLALLVTVNAFDRLGLDRKGIIGITMPGFGTTDRTYNNAVTLINELGITFREIPIAAACRQHFADIGLPESDRSVTYENAQARERTQILMDVANMENGLVIGTGDMSELALGWATYNGDHMSMYGVNSSVPKTIIRYLVGWYAETLTNNMAKAALLDIVDTPVSPELLPADEKGEIAQKTEDLVGPYELHDFFLYNFVKQGFSPTKILFLAGLAFEGRYDQKTILKWMHTFFRRFFTQQFKRSAMPDGPKVGTISLTARADWRMPSDASAALWLAECEELKKQIN